LDYVIIVDQLVVRVYPLCEAASKALLLMFVNELPKQAEIITMIEKLTSGTIKAGEFEDLVWKLLIRDAINDKGMSVPVYFLNGTSAGNFTLKIDDVSVISWQNEIPDSLQNQHILFRMTDDYPRFDFLSVDAFMQISISEFTKHNTGTASIGIALTDKFYVTREEYSSKKIKKGEKKPKLLKDNNNPSQVELIMKNLTGKDHEAEINKGQIIIKEKGTGKKAKTKIIYITLDKPYHPKYNKMKNILVISAREVWGNSATHPKKEKEDDTEVEAGLGMEVDNEEEEKEKEEEAEAEKNEEVKGEKKQKKEKRKKKVTQ